jgi:hypothetical protein
MKSINSAILYGKIKIVSNNNEINIDVIYDELTIEEEDTYSAGKIEKSIKLKGFILKIKI